MSVYFIFFAVNRSWGKDWGRTAVKLRVRMRAYMNSQCGFQKCRLDSDDMFAIQTPSERMKMTPRYISFICIIKTASVPFRFFFFLFYQYAGPFIALFEFSGLKKPWM